MKYFLLIICLALPAYLIRFSVFGIPTTLLEILIYVVFIIGLLNLKKAQAPKTKIWWPVGLFLAAALISVYIAPDKRVALGELKAWFIDPLMVFWLIVSYLKKEDFSWIIGGLAGSSLIVCGHAIYQKIIGEVTSDNRVIGLFGYSPNYLALFLAPIAVILIAYGIWLMAQKKYWLAAICGMLFAINLTAIYFSGSRTGLLAVAGGVGVWTILALWPTIRKYLWLKILLVIIIVTVITGAWMAFRPNFSLSPEAGSRVTSSNNVRWQIWGASLEMIQKNPLWGIGLGNYQSAFTEFTAGRTNFDVIAPWALSPHNLYLMVYLSLGLLGIAGFLGLLIMAIRIGLKHLDLPLAIILLAALATVIIQGFVDTPYFKNDLSLLFWLIIASMILLKKENN